MSNWILGKEIPYFKPLRSEFSKDYLNQLELSDKIIQEGWKKEDIINMILDKGFLDPNYPHYIRTSLYIITVENFMVTGLDKISNIKVIKKEVLPTFFKDFIKNNQLDISKFKRENGFDMKWILEDLEDAAFIKKEEELYLFETYYFIYKIDKRYKLQFIYFKDNELAIKKIDWLQKGVHIFFENKDVIIEEYYAQWLSFLTIQKEIYLNIEYVKDTPNKTKGIVEFLNGDWMVSPKVWKSLNTKGPEKNFLMNLFFEDWNYNSYLIYQNGSQWKVKGWRFTYYWDGKILTHVKTSNDVPIQKIAVEDNYLVLNNIHKTKIGISSPELITDLVEGNFINMLPRNSLDVLDFHPHATQRYEERIDIEKYTEDMIKEVVDNSYRSGIVVSGAHTNERRKIEADRYGYILSNNLVISVWDKKSNKKKRKRTY